jgi:cytochrome c peroxidase
LVFAATSIALVISGACWALFAAEKSQSVKSLMALPKEPPTPKDNPTTADKAALGKQLFFDPRLSGDNSMSCATCHLPDKALADGLAVSRGASGRTLRRNTQSLLDIAFMSILTWDGQARSLEEQALIPIQAADEMNQKLDDLETELNAVPGYVEAFKRVFGTKVTRDGIGKALATFERTLVTKPSAFDRYLAGDKKALSEKAKRGLDLFQGEAGCVRCHHGPMLSDGQFYRLGIASDDEGRASVTKDQRDKGRFRTPPLRNVDVTGPYMHGGSLATLNEVVTFYYRGIPSSAGKSLLDVEALVDRSFSEISDVVAFLESLSGEVQRIDAPQLPP